MGQSWSALVRGLTLVQFTWVTTLALLIATVDGPAAVVGAAIALAVLVAVSGHGVAPGLRELTDPTTGPPRESQRLRGAFRRQSAPDTPGRPRRPRAPGQVRAVTLR